MDSRKSPTFPARPEYDVIERWMLANEFSPRTGKPLGEYLRTWQTWVDEVNNVIRRIADQTESLDVSDDRYIGFIHMFATHPPRPGFPSLVDSEDENGPLVTSTRCDGMTTLHDRRNEFADNMEETYKGMAGGLEHCKLRFDSEGDFGMSDLSLSTGKSTRSHLHAILGCMEEFQIQGKTQDDELVDGLSRVKLKP